MQDKQQNTITIIGCGAIGRQLVQQLLSRKLAQKKQITTLVKSADSQAQCSQLGVTSICLNMDKPPLKLTGNMSPAESVMYYFVPPPSQGTVDSRAQEFIKQLREPPARIILISTTGVYGNCHGQWVTESTPLNPAVDRARRRFDAEQQFQAYCRQFKVPLVILRVSGIYGPGKLPLQRIRAKTPIVREQDSPYSNRIHSEDLLEICIKAGFSSDIEGIFNCADGHPTTMYDYFIKVARANKLPEPPSITLQQAKTQLSAGMLSYMAESRRIDNQKLLSAFNLSLKYPDLDQGLAHCNLD